MTTDTAVKTIQDHITAAIASTDSLSTLEVHRTNDVEDLAPPYITVNDTGAEEHEVVPKCLTVSVSVSLVTIPGDGDDNTTTAVLHRTMAGELQTILADYSAIADTANSEPYFLCFDVRGLAPTTSPADEVRTTTFPLVMVCQSQI